MTGRSKKFKQPSVDIYTDGGCEPNPGPGGYGVVLVHPKKRAELSGGFRLTTNNRMEIFAAIAGLEMLKQPCRVTLYSDSQYLVDAMTKGWVESWKRKQWWHSKTVFGDKSPQRHRGSEKCNYLHKGTKPAPGKLVWAWVRVPPVELGSSRRNTTSTASPRGGVGS